ncbi:protein-lysine N-methyltransferase EEF2KMT [Linepithema humile]|uniref:protein-lysine N-methyltransferase EEF2KMT n=1 Tax=Linepithema humile TaxID=83485 RepID=UPI00351E50A5
MDGNMSYDNNISYLTKQFLCCTAINKIDFMDGRRDFTLTLDIQKQILDGTINNDLIKQYPIKTSYQRAFLKLLMQKIKESDNEVYDDLYVTYCQLLSLPDEEDVHYRHFLLENGTLNCITLKESTNMISKGTTGLCSWQGGLVLSEWCAENTEQFYGKNVLELGCGVGQTGMNVISLCSPKQYVFSDYHPTVLDMLCENIKLNFLSSEQRKSLDVRDTTSRIKLQLKYQRSNVQVVELRWEDINEYMTKSLSEPDVIIAADILYESDSFASLTLGLKHLITSNNYAVFAATVRNEDTIAQFLKQLGNYNLVFEECIPPRSTISIQSIDASVRILKILQKI